MELHDWDSDGYWQGPRDLRIFLRANRFFAAFWFFLLTVIVLVLFFTGKIQLIDIPLGLLVAGAVWFALMFGFAHGWISSAGE